jgi:hypothetical protein
MQALHSLSPFPTEAKKKPTRFLQLQPSIMAHNDFSIYGLSYAEKEERSKYKKYFDKPVPWLGY